MDTILGWDTALFRIVNKQLAWPVLDPLMLLLSSTSVWLVALLLALPFLVHFKKKNWLKLLLWLGLNVAVADLLAFRVFKPLIQRPRPCLQLQDVRLVPEFCGGDYGFPSNHAANGVACAVALSLYWRRIFWSVFLLVFLVSYSRLVLGVHYPLDLAAGFLLGASVALTLHKLRLKLSA
ncbi:MAG: phosphatase PAP2 family protein [Oligoflexales bacterium]|nr:phosphatase PAP2 family protein [Oligoflexales bacterium]